MKVTWIIPTFLIVAVWTATGRAQAPSFPRENEQLAFATQLLGSSDYQYAGSSYEDFIRQFPHSALLDKAYLGAGDSHFFLRETQRALELYQQYEKLFPNGKEKWLVLLREGQCLFIDGKMGEAVSKFNSIDPASVQPSFLQTYYFYSGEALRKEGDLKGAGKNYEKVIEQKSTGEYATLSYLRLAEIFSRTGKTAEAAQLYDAATQSGDSMALQAKIQLIQAQSYLQARQYELAAMAFEKIVDGYPSLPASKQAAVGWFMALLKSNQGTQAISEYDRRFKDSFDDPSYGPVHLMAVNVLLGQNKKDQALEVLDNLINAPAMDQQVKDEAALQKAKISNATVFCSEAHGLYDQGQYSKAAARFMECFDKDKDTSYGQDALYSAFLAYQKANSADETVKTFEAYRTKYPQSPRIDDMTLDLADLYSQNKAYDKAISLLKPLAESPSSSQKEALFQVAYNLQLSGRTDDALKIYKIIISNNDNAQLTYMALKNSALIYSQNSDDDKVAETLDTIVRDFPSNDLTRENYLWLSQHWKQKKDTQRMRRVLDALNFKSTSGGPQ